MILYRHRTKDTLEPFYVGISSERTRPFLKKRRSSFWRNVESKHGRTVEILADNLSKDDACELEEFLIEEYGRRDLNNGPLVNMTSGGEHFKHSETSKKMMSEKKIGNKNSVGREDPKKTKVLDTSNNRIYDSISEAAKALGVHHATVSRWLSGKTKNKSSLTKLFF